MKCLLFLLAVLPLFHCAVVDTMLKQGTQVLNAAKTGKQVRECNCKEQKECVEEMQQQVQQCFDGCWGKVKTVSNNPQALKQCYQSKENVIEQMLTCVQRNMESCSKDGERKMIPHADIRKIINEGEEKLQQSAQTFLKTMGSGKELIQTAVDVGTCMKDCFLEKNKDGFCFDKHQCQPLIEPREARKEVKKCLHQIQWKKQASELCQCSQKAGVSNVGDFCGMLKVMSSAVQHH